jgi:hypothetical protein
MEAAAKIGRPVKHAVYSDELAVWPGTVSVIFSKRVNHSVAVAAQLVKRLGANAAGYRGARAGAASGKRYWNHAKGDTANKEPESRRHRSILL